MTFLSLQLSRTPNLIWAGTPFYTIVAKLCPCFYPEELRRLGTTFILTVIITLGITERAFSIVSTSQPNVARPMQWIAKDDAPVSVRHFLDSVPKRRYDYINTIQSNIASLKSEIITMKQTRDTVSSRPIPYKDVGNGKYESDASAEAVQRNQVIALTYEIEKKWKDVHADEAKIAEASNPLWLPAPEIDEPSTELHYEPEPLPANYMDYLVQVPASENSASAADTNCLTLVNPAWTAAGTAPVQTLRTGITGTGLQLKIVGDGIRVDSEDSKHLILNSQQRSMGLGELRAVPVAKLWLEGDKLNLQWLGRDAQPAVSKAMQFALLKTEDTGGHVVSIWRFSGRTDVTLNCAHSRVTKLPLDAAMINTMNWKVDGIPQAWTLQRSATTSSVSGGGITLSSGKLSLHISYDAATASVVFTRKDDMLDRYEKLSQQLKQAEPSVTGPTTPYDSNGTGMLPSETNGGFASDAIELRSLRRQIDAETQQWRALSSCTASIVLPNDLDVARFSFSADQFPTSKEAGNSENPSAIRY